MLIPFTLLFLFLVIRAGFEREPTWGRQVQRLAGSAIVLVGATAFLAPALSSNGHLSWLPRDFEWPIRSCDNVLELADGTLVVPHDPSGRIQIYDADLGYVRGWNIDAHGGAMLVVPGAGERFFVYTVRGRQKYEYEVSGELISSGTYSNDAESFGELPAARGRIELDPPLYLLPLTHPFAAFPITLLGAMLLAWVRPRASTKGSAGT